MSETKFASVKFASDFVDQARQEAMRFHRSIAAQIEHWATLGRAIERSPGVTINHVDAALQGRLSIDDLSEAEQESFFGLLGDHFDMPSKTAQTFFEARRKKGGGVGVDNDGNLARALPGGKAVNVSASQ